MINVYLKRPSWFLGVDASLEFLAAAIALLVTLASWRAFRMTKGKNFLYFTISFAMLTLSFASRAITDLLLEEVVTVLPANITGTVFFAGYISHIFLALTSYLILLALTLKINDVKVIALIGAILVPSLLLSGSYFISFYGLSLIFLSFITVAYYKNYKKTCKGSACFVFLSFLFLTLAQAQFLLETVSPQFYVIAHIFQAIGYVLLLMALVKILWK